jgi:NADH-quinone oxidoreductase subunit G
VSSDAVAGVDDATIGAGVPAPPIALHRWDGSAPNPPIVPVDAYALRLLAGRVLYGHDRVVVHSPALVGLESTPELLVNPRDRDRVGVADGGLVGVVTSRGRAELTVRGDAAVPEGLAYLPVNQAAPGAADLIDCTAPVTDLRLESLS